MRLVRLTLRGKILLGFSLLIALGLGMAGYGVIGLSHVLQSVGEMDTISGHVIRTQEETRLLEVLRRAATRYRIDADSDSLVAMTEAEDQIGALLAASAKEAVSETRRQTYQTIIQTLRSFTTERQAFARNYEVAYAERAKLFSDGAALTVATAQLMEISQGQSDTAVLAAAERFQSTVSLLRVAGLRFLASPDAAGPATFSVNESQTKAALAQLEHVAGNNLRTQTQSVQNVLSAYTASFATVSAALLEGGNRYEEKIGPQILAMQTDINKALMSLRKAFDASSAESKADATRTMWLQSIVAGVAAAIGVVLAILIGRAIVRPIASMTGAMTRLAAGELDIEIPARENTDEIGAMARAVDVFKHNAIENRQLNIAKEQEASARARHQAAMDSHTQDFGTSISGVMTSLVQSAATMHTAAEEMAAASLRTKDSTSGAVDGANASSRDLNAVAVAAEQMAASISEISRQVAHVTTAVQKAVDRASETDTKVASLASAADRIGDVVRLISDIASQTNLLALNATIEAARAGEAGKGFAVVASEVKTLATQTARATEQIGAQIVAIRVATEDAVGAVREVSRAIGQVESVATAIAAAVEQQAAATQEISSSVQSVTLATTSAAHAMGEVLTIAEQTDTSSRSVLVAADEVGRTAETLRAEVTDFLSAMTRDGSTERRAYMRISGSGAVASLTIKGHDMVRAEIRDISRGGIALITGSSAPSGTEVQVGLPAGGNVAGRVVRSDHKLITIALRQDVATTVCLDRTLDAISNKALASVA